jgi:hypothetical protein
MDLLKMTSALKFSKRDKGAPRKIKLYFRTLACLMHHQITSVHAPDFEVDWYPEEVDSLVQPLVQAIGTECPKLTSLDLRFTYIILPLLPSQREPLFRALPQLVNLQTLKINYFRCNDWVLQQFGKHCSKLV